MGEAEARDEDLFLALIAVLWTRRRWIVAAGLGAALLAGALSFVLPKRFRAEVAVVPATQLSPDAGMGIPASLAGAAREFGVSLPGSGGDPSSLFPAILKSRAFAVSMLARSFDGGPSLMQRLADADQEEPRRSEEAIDRFRRRVIGSAYDLKSGVTRVSIVLPDAELAAAVANGAVEELDRFNREAKAKQAQRWVEFVAERLQLAAQELRAAEEQMKGFRQRNRSYVGSPELELEDARLFRDVQLRQEVFVTLQTQYELARIEEVKNLPVLSVIDQAHAPLRKHSPKRGLIALAALMIGLALSVVISLGVAGASRLTRLRAAA